MIYYNTVGGDICVKRRLTKRFSKFLKRSFATCLECITLPLVIVWNHSVLLLTKEQWWTHAMLPGGRLNKKDGLTRYGNSHVKDKTS